MKSLRAFLGLNYYTSELDQFLTEFDHSHPTLTLSQRKEKEKYQRIYKLRDNPNAQKQEQDTLWDQF